MPRILPRLLLWLLIIGAAVYLSRQPGPQRPAPDQLAGMQAAARQYQAHRDNDCCQHDTDPAVPENRHPVTDQNSLATD
jgi:hypothetical protein